MKKFDRTIICRPDGEETFVILTFEFVGMKLWKDVFMMRRVDLDHRVIYVPQADNENVCRIYSVTIFETDSLIFEQGSAQSADPRRMNPMQMSEMFSASL